MPKNVYDGIEEILTSQKEESDKQKEILALLKEDKERSIKEHEELIATIKQSASKNEIVRSGNYRSPNQIFQSFLKRATQELVYIDSKEEFTRKKKVCLKLILVSIGLMLLCSVAATASFGLYSTFTFFENIWLFLMLFVLRYTLKTKRVYYFNVLPLAIL